MERNEMKICSLRNENLQFTKWQFTFSLRVYNMRASKPASHASQHVSQHASYASHASQHKITLFLM